MKNNKKKTENTVLGKWKEIKTDIRAVWKDLTENDLEKTKGDLKQIKQLLRNKYGTAQNSYNEKIDSIFKRFSKELTIEKGIKNTAKYKRPPM